MRIGEIGIRLIRLIFTLKDNHNDVINFLTLLIGYLDTWILWLLRITWLDQMKV